MHKVTVLKGRERQACRRTRASVLRARHPLRRAGASEAMADTIGRTVSATETQIDSDSEQGLWYDQRAKRRKAWPDHENF